jgi:hypothetical protein
MALASGFPGVEQTSLSYLDEGLRSLCVKMAVEETAAPELSRLDTRDPRTDAGNWRESDLSQANPQSPRRLNQVAVQGHDP